MESRLDVATHGDGHEHERLGVLVASASVECANTRREDPRGVSSERAGLDEDIKLSDVLELISSPSCAEAGTLPRIFTVLTRNSTIISMSERVDDVNMQASVGVGDDMDVPEIALSVLPENNLLRCGH